MHAQHDMLYLVSMTTLIHTLYTYMARNWFFTCPSMYDYLQYACCWSRVCRKAKAEPVTLFCHHDTNTMRLVPAVVKSIKGFIHQLHDSHRNFKHMEWYKLDMCLHEFEKRSADPFVMSQCNNSEIWKGHLLDGVEFVSKIICLNNFHIFYNEVFYLLKLCKTTYITHLHD